MPEINNPAKLGFRVSEAAWREETYIYDNSVRDTAVIPLRVIFADDLTRTLWLAIKQRHLTSQYFHHQITRAAASIRERRPTDHRDLHYRIADIIGEHGPRGEMCDSPFCKELFVYLVNVLDGGDAKLTYTEPESRAA